MPQEKKKILAFFDNEGMIYTNYGEMGKTINAEYIVKALGKFLKAFKAHRPEKAAGN